MSVRFALRTAAAIVLLWAGSAQAFRWSSFDVPPGDQRYVVEVLVGDGSDTQVATMDIRIVDAGDAFDVTSTMTTVQRGVRPSEVANAVFTGGSVSLYFLGGMAAGPAAYLVPMLLGDHDVRVRTEPIVFPGLGSLHMLHEETVAGLTCVVMRVEIDNADDDFEFAVAEGVPFPCFSRYGVGAGRVETRLLLAE